MLRDHALRIWRAGVDAVRPERLFRERVRRDGLMLRLGDHDVDLARFDRIAVVGAGKAGAGMVRGLEASLGDDLIKAKRLTGLVAVPGDCLGPTRAVRLVAGRPAGVNEPRPEGAAAARQVLRLVGGLGPSDLCLCLVSGGGSALLPAPIDGVTLPQLTRITRLLSAAGAAIDQLNTVRSVVSRIGAGSLASACHAGELVGLIISDVLGDPLHLVASGPTAPSNLGPADALAVLGQLGLIDHPQAAPVSAVLRRLREKHARPVPVRPVTNVVLANNAAAVDAAGAEAERLGHRHAMDCAPRSEGAAEEVGRRLAEMAIRMRDRPGPDCLITGGEPTVTLADESVRGRGGRNQQLALAALRRLGDCRGVALLSGGTDGEDGPTDAAGAVADEAVARSAEAAGLDAAAALARNDAYHFFAASGGLIRTGPTGTNVCDLRVVVVDSHSR